MFALISITIGALVAIVTAFGRGATIIDRSAQLLEQRFDMFELEQQHDLNEKRKELGLDQSSTTH